MTPTTSGALEGARAAYGFVQLGRSGGMAKLLGARLALQAAVTLLGVSGNDRHARQSLHQVGGVVDGLHAASMIGLAAVSRRHRSEAVHQALAAGGFAAAEFIVSR
jgi:hypothetical protein